MRSLKVFAVLTLMIGILAGCDSMGEQGESGTQFTLTETARETRSGVELVMNYDGSRKVFTGTVTNTTSSTVTKVRVEIHLSNGTELGPTPNVDLAAGETKSVELDASTHSNFNAYSVHVEIGSSRS